jgi:hyperosmotically inducible protein
MKTLRKLLMMLVAVCALAVPAATTTQAQGLEARRITEKVRKELVTLPWYGVFDNLAYKVEGGTVTLYGQAVRPTTRSDAARRVSRIPGVERVVNNIEVLPLSSFDDSIRVNAYNQIFSAGSLYRYARGTNPSIHIVVRRGHITLEGVVANKMDKQVAYMAARQVPGAFSVTNNLIAENERGAR